jgi:hypothetical protein
MATTEKNRRKLRGIRINSCDAVITAKVPVDVARKLQDAARASCRTVSGEIRSMLIERFGGRG